MQTLDWGEAPRHDWELVKVITSRNKK
jgi:hypothetical protein